MPEPQAGIVGVVEWIKAPNGQDYRMFGGEITIHAAKETLGIDVVRGEVNWFVDVRTPDGTIHIPGCKVAAIFAGDWLQYPGVVYGEAPDA